MRTGNQFYECQIWTGYEGRGYYDGMEDIFIIESSPRAGGSYVITYGARHIVQSNQITNKDIALLTTILVDQRAQGIRWPKVTPELIQEAKRRPSLPIHERAQRLLKFIANQTRTAGKGYDTRQVNLAAYAWSESIQAEEVNYLIDYLLKENLLNNSPQTSIQSKGNFLIPAIVMVSVKGHRAIEQEVKNVDSSQAFVAMWFDSSMEDAYESGIEPAIEEAGYKALRIDRKEYINKIDDEIIAELRRSRFIVADFTHGKDGARGGVYYEAGFAHGLDLPVIFTCREDGMKSLHFDTNHFNHIVWKNPQDLRRQLKNRILSVIGEGPEVDRVG